MADSTTSLLPGLLLAAAAPDAGQLLSVADAAEAQLRARLQEQNHLAGDANDSLYAPAAAAGLRALALRHGGGPGSGGHVAELAGLLCESLLHSSVGSAVSPRVLARALQAMRSLNLRPPEGLVSIFASMASEPGAMEPEEIVEALRLVADRGIAGNAALDMTALASAARRAGARLRSMRLVGDLDALCNTLGIELEDPSVLPEDLEEEITRSEGVDRTKRK